MNKQKDKNFIEYLLSKKGIFAILIFVIFILFFDSIFSFYNKTIVNQILGKINSDWKIDILFIVLTILTLISTRYFVKINKRISNVLFFILLFFFCLFIYFRLSSEEYSFQHSYLFVRLFYIDYLFILFICFAIIKVANWINNHKWPIFKDSPFLIDRPILISKDDKFSRQIFAKKISEKIQSKLKVDKAGALAIGINGAWGSGKTSFTNMIKEHIDTNNRILIDFNPWRSSSSNKIVEDFFEQLIKEIKPYDPSLSNKIADYARTLTKIEENILTKSIDVVADFLFDEKSKDEAYESINSSIEKIKKQIIIFIDDLDRLDKKEIVEVLRVIRNTANFNNVVYVVSYDKGYIQTAIKHFNEYNYKSFLEKIFQFEFSLPMYEHEVLRTEIKRLLKAGLQEKFGKEIERVVDSKENLGKNFTNEIVKTHRDVIRLVNSLLFEIETVQDEVFFYDFYLLQLLKLKFPKVYESLIEKRNAFFIIDSESKRYRLKTVKEQKSNETGFHPFSLKKEIDKSNDGEVTTLVSWLTNLSQDKIAEGDIQLIESLIEVALTLKNSTIGPLGLFVEPEFQYPEQDAQLYKSFAYPENFHKYFAFKLYEGDISAAEFEYFRRKDIDSYKEKVIQWIKDGKYSALIDRLNRIEEFTTIAEFENQILILIEIGRYQLKNEEANPYWMDYNVILKNIRYPMDKNNSAPYDSRKGYKSFLLDTFKNAEKPPLYESGLIATLIKRYIDIPLSQQELLGINFSYFNDYCATHNKITKEFRFLHSNCINTATTFSSDFPITDEANALFKKYYLDNLSGCDLAGFIRHSKPESDYFEINQNWLQTFFPAPTWPEFENYLKVSETIRKEKECYVEFMQFYELVKASDYKSVEFVFQYLKPSLWTGGTKSNPSR
jgi:Cdc6-like AAA superfamily ATPase